MPKRPSNNHGPSAKKFHKLSSRDARNSADNLVRRRVEAQRKRLNRLEQRLKQGNVSQELDLHLDGCRSYAEAVLAGDELAAEQRVRHLRRVHRILPPASTQPLVAGASPVPPSSDSSSSSSAAATAEVASSSSSASLGTAAVVELDPESFKEGIAVRPELVLALLDQGEAGEAEVILDELGVAACGSASWWEHNPRQRTPLAFSKVLVDFVAWREGDKLDQSAAGALTGIDEKDCEAEESNAGQEEEEEEGVVSPEEAAAILSLDAALEANPYVGVFLANLAVFVREIDPAVAAEARHACPAKGKKEMGGGKGPAEESGDGPEGASGPFEGSVEEALSYASTAAGCWIDFIGHGVETWVQERLSLFSSTASGEGGGGAPTADVSQGAVSWPPRRCSHPEGLKFQGLFVEVAELAEAEAEAADADAADDDDDDDADAGDDPDADADN